MGVLFDDDDENPGDTLVEEPESDRFTPAEEAVPILGFEAIGRTDAHTLIVDEETPSRVEELDLPDLLVDFHAIGGSEKNTVRGGDVEGLEALQATGL
tara:strand:- start:6785 stop:7078 length:294 start_codon:yes stop_codon:yes gene_type:complete